MAASAGDPQDSPLASRKRSFLRQPRANGLRTLTSSTKKRRSSGEVRPLVNPAGGAQDLPREHRRRWAAASRWLQLRSGALRGARPAGRSPLLPLPEMPAPNRYGSVDQRACRAWVCPHHSRPRAAASVETGGRPREVVLRRVRIVAVQHHARLRRSHRYPHGSLRHRSGDPPQRSVLRCLRRAMGADPRRRATPLRCQAPQSSVTASLRTS